MTITPINELDTTRDMISAFGGYNHNMDCGENEFYEESNLSADYYPAMAPRRKREDVVGARKVNGIFLKNGLFVATKDFIFRNSVPVLPVTDSRKVMCGMGGYLLIWPDKKIFNTADGSVKDMGAKKQTSGTVTFTMCTLEGAEISPIIKSPQVSMTAPASPSNGDYWIDISSTPNKVKRYSGGWTQITTCSNGAIYWMDTSCIPNALKIWSESESQWASVATSYTKISNTGIGKAFEKYDVVHIEGVTGSIAETFNQDMAIWDKQDNFIIVTALLTNNTSQTGMITLERKIPDMDFVCESENRVWGCSSEKHEIYCCKQGDPTNWYSYMGTAADSYAATIGTDGDFTGCCAYGGQVLFFKEDCIHKVYGNCPANYQINTSYCRGVEKGSERSLALVNEILYYKSREDICAYDGSTPMTISAALGGSRYEEASAGALGGKYYVCMKNRKTERYETLVYDSRRGIWHKEDSERMQMLTYMEGALYYWSEESAAIRRIRLGEEDSEEQIEWMAETGIIGLTYPNNKYVSKICMRLSLSEKSEMCMDVMYDSDNKWEEAAKIESMYEESRRDTPSFVGMRSYEVPIIPMRCDHMRIRLRGKGDMRIYSISKVMEQGGY